jgi:4-hydroxy-tetrahydrodipicolinate synthase
MKDTLRISGVLAPVVTPFDQDFKPDATRLVAHCKWLISQNCGLAVFGTNSEGNSLSVEEKCDLLDVLVDAKIDPSRMMPGTGTCALMDTVRLTAKAVQAGCAGVLMLPPFYYKGVSMDGLYRSFAEVIERVGDASLRIYLYHIPPVAIVGITPQLIERLFKAYPTAIAGIKDSSGDWANTKTLLDAFSGSGFDVFVGSESFLLANMQNGGAGCISATANVNPATIDRLFCEWRSPDAAAQQAELNDLRNLIGQRNMIASLKAVIAHFTDHRGWSSVRPPLDPLTYAEASDLIGQLEEIGFKMPGITGLDASH